MSGPIFLVGGTGVGKSEGAMAWARAHGGSSGAAILAMDAMQVYRGAEIGTGKPSGAERAEVPHGGLDLAEFGEGFDAARYLEHAGGFLREQRAAGRRVMIVGGTGLYFRALTRGLCEAPQGPAELRAELGALPVEELRARLARVDPAMLGRVDASNPRRLVRAIEVMEATGRSLREWQEETPEPLVPEFTAFWIQRGKEELEARIEARVEAMFAAGWVEEVRGLAARYGMEAVRAFPGIGYREIGGWLERSDGIASCALRAPGQQVVRATRGDGVAPLSGAQGLLGDGGHRPPLQVDATATGEAGLSAVKGDILVATRQYAKRQLTWFSREPKLRAIMLSGNQPISAALSFLF